LKFNNYSKKVFLNISAISLKIISPRTSKTFIVFGGSENLFSESFVKRAQAKNIIFKELCDRAIIKIGQSSILIV